MLKYDSLKELVDDIERYTDLTDIKVDLVSIIFETLNYLKSAVNIKQLENKIAASKSVDMQPLDSLLEGIKKLDLINISVTLTEGIEIKYDDLYDEFESFILKIKEVDHQLETSELSLRIAWVGERILRDIFICAISKPVSLENIESMVLSKLELLDDNTVFKLWDRVLSEFDTSR